MYVENNESKIRKQICEQIQQTHDIHDFNWANQSWTSLTNSLFKTMVGYLPEGSYNNKTREILDRYYPIALQWCSFDDKPESLVNIDICKQFPSILILNSKTIPIYTIHDNIEKFEGKQEMDNDIGLYYPELNQNGEFYIDTFTIKQFGNQIKFPNGFNHVSLIDFFVYECGMPISNIKYKLIARHGIKADTFKDFMLYIFKTFPEQIAKKMANSFIGDLGRKYNRTNYGFTCQILETAQNIWIQGLTDGKNITIDNFEDLYLIREQKIDRILSDHTSINRYIISLSILQCLQLLKNNWTEHSELYSINTDGFYMTNPKHSYRNKADIKFDVKHIGEPFVTNGTPNYFDKHYRENLDYKSFTDKVSKTGKIYYGQAGCGKSWRICQLIYENRDKCIVFSHTNKAVVNIKNILKDKHKSSPIEVNKLCHTFESYFLIAQEALMI